MIELSVLFGLSAQVVFRLRVIGIIKLLLSHLPKRSTILTASLKIKATGQIKLTLSSERTSKNKVPKMEMKWLQGIPWRFTEVLICRQGERAQRISRLMGKLSSKIVKRGARTFQ